MKFVIIAAALAISIAAPPSFAGEVPVSFNWSGFYAGVNGGYGSVSSIWNKREGGFGGGQIGFNWQYDRVVFGPEVDGLAGRISGDTGPYFYAMSNTLGGIISIRGRGGIALNQFLLYGTIGIAYAKNEFYWMGRPGMQTIGRPIISVPMVDAQWHDGWTTGAGLEYAFDQHWSTRFLYTYTRFGARGYLQGGTYNNYGFDLSSASIGVNYRF